MNNIMQNIITSVGPPYGPITPARIEACSHVVHQRGLARSILGDVRFGAACEERRAWIAENCIKDHVIQPVRDNDGQLSGRDYRFENELEAVAFKLVF